MIIEYLLECPPDKLEAMSSDDLYKHLEPYLKVTRPDLAEKPQRSPAKQVSELAKKKQETFSKKKQAEMILAQYGITVKLT